MSKSITLPLYDEFLKIFINHEIKNWQAKHFWEKMGLNQPYRAKRCKRLMYVGLRILLRCKYLEIDVTQSSKKAFSYKETPRLNELRDKYKKQKLEAIFSIKKSEFLNQIKDKENNIEFIESLLLDDKTLEKYFINHKEKLETDIKNIKSNIKFMDGFMS
ncbi:hypothetical protein CDG62_11535 [Acinetobacter sp. WCHA55]|uniref:hypothetical protein n=1 Tax=Acinetobacter sp. WCHA55 TaxID=2004646 RepID=UPI000B3C68D7|nr:hypothetical protein [Acinetobacter sp. WCHA55]AYA68929.1 hypothetical protein CDG62_11535 [Acinetobacter sp. WCHA55]